MRKIGKITLVLFLILCLLGANLLALAETPYRNGDVDNSGDLSAADAAMILRHLAGITPLTGNALAAADADLDGDVTAADAAAVLRHLAGLSILPGWGTGADLNETITLGAFLQNCVGMSGVNYFAFNYDTGKFGTHIGHVGYLPKRTWTIAEFSIEELLNAENPADVRAAYVIATLVRKVYKDETETSWFYEDYTETIENPTFDDLYRMQCEAAEGYDMYWGRNDHPDDHDYTEHANAFEQNPMEHVKVVIDFTLAVSRCLGALRTHAESLGIPEIGLWHGENLSILESGDLSYLFEGIDGVNPTYFAWNPREEELFGDTVTVYDIICLYYTVSSEDAAGMDAITFEWEYGKAILDWERVTEIYSSGTAMGTEILDIITQLYTG
ncbi:MAG: dockerin type I domain-containing protein [Clostridiales bacterium]|nr:dockerin type I domain-containing protein [Clostridiales bacterium]